MSCSIDYALLDTYRQRVEMLNHVLKPIVLPSYCGKQGIETQHPSNRREELQSGQQLSAAHLTVGEMLAHLHVIYCLILSLAMQLSHTLKQIVHISCHVSLGNTGGFGRELPAIARVIVVSVSGHRKELSQGRRLQSQLCLCMVRHKHGLTGKQFCR